MSRILPISHGQRPVLAIDTAPSHTNSTRPPSLSISRSGIPHNGEIGSSTVTAQSSSTVPEQSPKTASSSRQSFISLLKAGFVIPLSSVLSLSLIKLILNSNSRVLICLHFVQDLSARGRRRSPLHATSAAVSLITSSRPNDEHLQILSCKARKLKCDGGRPACSQCFKRSNPCDYMTNHKRRGAVNGRQRKQNAGSDGSECDSGNDPSGEAEGHPSQSPEVASESQPPSRRNSNVSMLLTDTLPPLSTAVERRDDTSASNKLPPIQQATSGLLGAPPPPPPLPSESHPYPAGSHELPPIATLSAASASAYDEGNQNNLPSIRAVEAQSQPQHSRRRTTTLSGRGTRQTSGNGSKIVACNYCRGASAFTLLFAV